MRIALCDDESSALLALRKMIQQFCERRSLAAAVDLFLSGEDFLASAQEYDIVFMDIYLTGMNGMDAVKQSGSLRAQQIVFTTTSQEHAIEAFGLNAAHYLVKPLTSELVAEAMERCLTRLRKTSQKSLPIKTSCGIVSVPMEQIMFIEVFNKRCIVHTVKNEFHTYTSLDALFEQLDDSFLRAQRSYIVNMRFIKSFIFDRVILQTGMEIMLSRSSRAELKKQYQRFIFHLARE